MNKGILGLGAAALMLAGASAIAAPARAPSGLAAAVANPERPEADTARDADRKPAEMLAFAGVRPGWKVVELSPGGGYFTRLLSAAVGERGYVYTNATRVSAAVEAWAKTHPNVSLQLVQAGQVAAPEPVDLVWTTQNYHDFKNTKVGDSDQAAAVNAAAFAALKPGGVYLVSDHQGAAGSGATQTNTLHRIEDAAVIREVEAAGFKLEARSPLLRHEADDHTQKVFETGVRGKTDQFVLKFRKPRGRR
ncbi:class I SAM-dependent methyltransferase [Novosphingobium sp. JCM 18896]|uniref:class I SAM-dependent methyltransferase n=1 Tax=Novosphingobium sp. JCM 18896 TaxID=2989731 RepID=UPI0022218768|nr:methyltransferase [Novosphingobium sp. JCM 18896]MCW1430430.1 methyltransferase [Novosphingobium sp. JCM 18896]